MSAFEALRLVRTQQMQFPHLSLKDCGRLVSSVHSTATGLDFEVALALNEIVRNHHTQSNGDGFYRDCIEDLIRTQRPTWVRIIAYGRQRFVEKLARDEAQCFRAAGLLIDPPTEEVILWWDRISGEARRLSEEAAMLRARHAERLSLEVERDRLNRLGIKREPRWTAIEDNFAGYDIHSYDLGKSDPVARLIEVKSNAASPMHFFLSRNEWDSAQKFRSAYVFHIWDLRVSPPRLYERTVADVEPHIPVDRVDGIWTNVEINLE